MKKFCCPLILLLAISFIAPAQQLAPSIQWQKCLGGSGDDMANEVLQTADNSILIVGSTKSNNGDVSGYHGLIDSTDAWVVKLSLSGNILWERSFGGSGTDVFNSVIATSDGNYLCLGTTASIDGDVSGLHGANRRPDIWLVKIDRNGNVIWKKCYGGSSLEKAGKIKQNKDGSLYFIGSTSSSDGDVMGSFNTPPNYYSDIWVLKLTKDGDIISQKCLGGTDIDEGYDIFELENGNYLISGMVSSFNTQFGDYTIQPYGVISKIDSNGVVKWTNRPYSAQPLQLTNPAGNVYYASMVDWYKLCPQNVAFGTTFLGFTYSAISGLTGSQSGSGYHFCNNSSPKLGYRTSPSSLHSYNGGNIVALATDDTLDNNPFHRGGSYNGFLAGLSPVGNSITTSWKKIYGGSSEDVFTSVVHVNDNEMIAVGYTKSNDGDVSGNHGGRDIWVVRLGQANTIKGTVFLDYNSNGNLDANEPLLNNIVVQSQKGTVKVGSSTYKGAFRNSVDTGTYTTSILTPVRYFTPYPSSKISNLAAYNITDSISFAMRPVPGSRDYSVQLFCPEFVRPGFNNTYRIVYANPGTDTLLNKTIRLIKDPRIQFLSALPAAASVSGDTISWVINQLNPRDTGTITYKTKSLAPPVLNFGDFINSSVLIDSTADVTPLDNLFNLRQHVTGGYDPNDKQESAGGFLNTRELADNKYLQYTIRFQNTGNDTAFNISVRDTLSAKTDWASLEMVAASHPYELTIKNGNQLTWNFNNILLADSLHNEPLSHGYIVYRIKPAAALQAGDTIKNTASIYFDFNPPVKTNEQLTIIKAVNPAVPTPVVSGIQNNYCTTGGVQKPKIMNLPLQGSGITATVKLDVNALSIASDSTFSFDPAALSAGTHRLFVQFANSAGSDSLVYNIVITASVTPDVNLSANTASITNLATPVTITASNAAGGGSTPLYTFASDRNFTAILQAESSNTLYNVNTTLLPMGDTWIYVKMKTSATCYTALTNTDSIKLNKLLVPAQPVITGLASNYCGGLGVQKIKITNTPAANYLATVTAKLDGAIVLTVGADSTITLQPTTIAAGNHTIVVIFTNASGNNSTTLNFAVTQASAPDVNVSANITTIVNLTDPVIITATNASGGGTAPKYTFAKDRSFTNIIQAEGSSATVTIQPGTLTSATNKIYVLMKTSDTCYTAQTAIDSISIERSAVTGITDVDFPNQVINVFPNPFAGKITISGLNTGKTYVITLSNAGAQKVYTRQFSNSSNAVVDKTGLQAGRYWLSIYDVKKNRIIGSVMLIKE